VSPVQQQAAYDSVFHQLQQAQHRFWQSTWHWTHHPNTKQQSDCNILLLHLQFAMENNHQFVTHFTVKFPIHNGNDQITVNQACLTKAHF